jgi:hypothetical protein
MKTYNFEKMIEKRILTQNNQGYIFELRILEVSPNKNFVKVFNKTKGVTQWVLSLELEKEIVDVLSDISYSTSNNTSTIIS